jgi:hypothetical protein
MITNITWNNTGWEDVSHDKSNKRHIPGESWNFYFPKHLKTKKGYFQVRDNRQPKRFVDGGIVFFFSRNNYEHINYLVGLYANAKYIGKTQNGNLAAPV